MIRKIARAVGGVPTLTALLKAIPDEEAAALFVECLRWPGGFRCSRCGSDATPYRYRRYMHARVCRSCHAPSSLAIIRRQHLPLLKWIVGIWLIGDKRGSIHLLHRVAGLRYETAWLMARRIRNAL